MKKKILFTLLTVILSFSTLSRKVEDMDISDADRAQTNAINEEFSKMELQRLCEAEKFEDDGVTAVKDDISRICAGGEMEVMGMSETTVQMASKAYQTMVNFINTSGLLKNLKKAADKKEEKKKKPEETPAQGEDRTSSQSKPKGEPNPSSPTDTPTGQETPKPAEQTDTAANAQKPEADGNTKPEEKAKTEVEEEKKEYVDVCGYIGGGVETISGFQQQNFQKHLSDIPTNADNAQTESLHKIKRNYREKSKNNSTNAIGWGATSTCYVASYAVSPPVGWGWAERVLKTTASGFLTVFNGLLSKRNKQASNELARVIQQMPGKGDCNPITERNCFCSLPSNLNNQKYCLPEIRARLKRSYGTQMVCLDRFRRPDDDCSCIARNDCFDKTFMSAVEGLNFGESFEELNRKNIKAISRGGLGRSDGQLASLSDNAIKTAKRALRSVPLKNIPRTKLSKEQLGQINDASSLGIPKALAATLAAQRPASSSLQRRIRGGKSGYSRKYTPSRRSTRKNNLRLSGGTGSIKSGSSKRKSSRGYTKPSLSRSSSQKVQKFAEQARKNASIVNKPEVSIFKIISVRYQRTKSRRLE